MHGDLYQNLLYCLKRIVCYLFSVEVFRLASQYLHSRPNNAVQAISVFQIHGYTDIGYTAMLQTTELIQLFYSLMSLADPDIRDGNHLSGPLSTEMDTLYQNVHREWGSKLRFCSDRCHRQM